MSLYVLVEGQKTEKIIYPSWISQVAGLKKKDTPEDPDHDSFYIVSGYGYPSIINHIDNSILEINEYGYTNFWIVIDADDEDIEFRRNKIKEQIGNKIRGKVNVHIIIQNICIETFGLANNSFFPKNATDSLNVYKSDYDVTLNDPSLLTKNINTDKTNSAQYHVKYLKAIFGANQLKYTKKKPR